MTNLLQETIDCITNYGKNPADVLWVGSRDGELSLSWEDFVAAANINYNSGYGGQEIACDLVVVGSYWWLEREEYDGSEGWAFKIATVLKPDHKPFTHLTSKTSWATLEEYDYTVKKDKEDES